MVSGEYDTLVHVFHYQWYTNPKPQNLFSKIKITGQDQAARHQRDLQWEMEDASVIR